MSITEEIDDIIELLEGQEPTEELLKTIDEIEKNIERANRIKTSNAKKEELNKNIVDTIDELRAPTVEAEHYNETMEEIVKSIQDISARLSINQCQVT